MNQKMRLGGIGFELPKIPRKLRFNILKRPPKNFLKRLKFRAKYGDGITDAKMYLQQIACRDPLMRHRDDVGEFIGHDVPRGGSAAAGAMVLLGELQQHSWSGKGAPKAISEEIIWGVYKTERNRFLSDSCSVSRKLNQSQAKA